MPEAAAERPDATLVRALRDGDEAAFATVVREWHRPLLAVVRPHVPSDAVADEVVQDTWLAVIRGLDAFEGRSSLRTWVLHIARNQARTRGEREWRTMAFSSAGIALGDDGPAVPPERFRPPRDARWPGHWATAPAGWGEDAAERLLRRETQAVVARALAEVPPGQRAVMTLRDVEGWSSEEVCAALDISAANQRVLLHRARSRVRAALERHLADAGGV